MLIYKGQEKALKGIKEPKIEFHEVPINKLLHNPMHEAKERTSMHLSLSALCPLIELPIQVME